MRQDMEEQKIVDRAERETRRGLYLVFLPWFVAAAFVSVLLIGVVLTPPEYRSWTIGAGILLVWIAGISYLVWALRYHRRRSE
jgi:hypothetical protein